MYLRSEHNSHTHWTRTRYCAHSLKNELTNDFLISRILAALPESSETGSFGDAGDGGAEFRKNAVADGIDVAVGDSGGDAGALLE